MSEGGDPRFFALLDEMRALHQRKSADYGQGKDFLSNLRQSADFNIPPWVGTVVRMNDKITRIKSLLVKGSLTNEPVEDSLLDIAAYALLALILYRESKTL
jgi:hypothetical protein